ncbi:MAG: hypothetical protein ACFCAD_03220 [Pleurocapsa sp.]
MKQVIINNYIHPKYKYVQAYGLVIPYLYVYTYQEKTHYHHHVPGGVVGSLRKKEYLTTKGLKQEYLSPEWQRFVGQRRLNSSENYYQIFPASNIFRDTKQYRDKYQAREQFVSDLLSAGESISIICQQCDETLRSIAGLMLLIPVFLFHELIDTEDDLVGIFGLPPDEVNLLDIVGVKIYELDLPSGVSPLDAQKEELGKYKHLLVESTITKSELTTSIRFKRSSNQQYFEIELTNLGDKPGNAVISSAAFIQSAHITLHPKLSRRLQVSRMHFRMWAAT